MLNVVKPDGGVEPFDANKLLRWIDKLTTKLSPEFVVPNVIVNKVTEGLHDNITLKDLLNLTAETTAYMATQHPDYAKLAGRIAVAMLHMQTSNSFSEVIGKLRNYVNGKTKLPSPLVAEDVYDIVMQNADTLNAAVDYNRDFSYDYFGFKTLERSYLLNIDGKIVERPQHMLMRVSVGIHKEDIAAAIETYNLLSEGLFTHASPTLFNSGTPRPQLSSCFLVCMKDDSIEGIYETLKTCALISKSAGGIGVSVHNIRASGSYIRGTNGQSNGLVPMLRVFNDTARYVDQGGGKRKGAFAVYLEPWHDDIFDFLNLKKNHGKEEHRARDLFYALWISDLFMQRVESNGSWSLFCPNEAPGLADVWGDDFVRLYEQYEREGRARRVVKAQDVWFAILESQIETGTPFMLYKDACNAKSNQQNLGTIKSSNLCTEIVEYTAPDEVAVCNLASIALPRFISKRANGERFFDHEKLAAVTKVITRNLNKIIDLNYYPVPEARKSNFRHRPIGLGVQGLADALLKLRLPFDCDEARTLNKDIFETIYYGAVSASNELAKVHGPYETFAGSPASKGQLQFDLWGVKPESGRWDWDTLKRSVVEHGMRNSLLVAPMPTASTSQILGNNECFEPYTSNIYTRRVLAGEFPIVNKHLVKDLVKLGLWTPDIRNMIIAHNGSIQAIQAIPEQFRELHRTVWEIKQRSLIDMAAERGPYIDQSQSFNVFIGEATVAKLTSMHFYAWKKGLKTGMYYLRTRPAADAIKFTVDQTALNNTMKQQSEITGTSAAAETATSSTTTQSFAKADTQVGEVCRKEEGCIVCGS